MRRVSIQLEEETYESLQQRANAEQRSLANMASRLIQVGLALPLAEPLPPPADFPSNPAPRLQGEDGDGDSQQAAG